MDYIIQAENITKSFSQHSALQDVSIAVPRGEIFGLLGPNGAGKTTLLRIINGIIKPDRGSVLLNKVPPSSSNNQSIGYLPEERGLYRKMKVEEQLIYLAQLKGLSKASAKAKIEYWMNKLEVHAWKNKTIEELSKGMAQKIQFIATLVHDPELLILDEPFSGFDPINAALIKNELLELKKNGTSIILSTHNMNSVEELCTEITLLNQSKKILSGKVQDIKKQFHNNEFEIFFEGNMISFTTALWSGFELLAHEVLDKNKFKVRVKAFEGNAVNTLVGALISTCKILSIQEVVPSMNEIFINQVNNNLIEIHE